jgi:hypothetical protein
VKLPVHVRDMSDLPSYRKARMRTPASELSMRVKALRPGGRALYRLFGGMLVFAVLASLSLPLVIAASSRPFRSPARQTASLRVGTASWEDTAHIVAPCRLPLSATLSVRLALAMLASFLRACIRDELK